LYYNDDLEELRGAGYFKYLIYPFKVSAKFIKNKLGICNKNEKKE